MSTVYFNVYYVCMCVCACMYVFVRVCVCMCYVSVCDVRREARES